MYTCITKNVEETKELGKKLGKSAKSGMVFLLYGDLGSGKTCLTKGIGLGLNINATINSPTFNILKIYEGDLTLNHIDAYRLEGINQDLGFDEQIDGEGLTVIEWPQYIMDTIGDNYLKIEIIINEDDTRTFNFYPYGKEYEVLLKEIVC
ncbi:MAG TPA: tRNA (adenosine(37)-N6)-threonylcarbamoyltransferase complex ATPase subunit type 1 TsaE [Erysipelotrichaceae bacterium]|jgi:tRNA threonylcarbamoyladenosine biosynthesis protein TsaE|nr:tRNA (adenosine(37)-N6)-threonylcarbamoyltransferase complex ATPase subunit type 1 TsaE [Bacillota bacterium]NLP21239.1 tRNA (adenosine(37)-N6)-threonylcarbamoyltransferase complex ATPase subunit type 1 TsaE [Erysipelotrichaceae bacterium]HCY07120.1 tRNA (adenosine(37)-N6)-threonylcarbamoyltransferase complex ATPase subunit type 1 TsaE [Erysipelotrichaceae bacterium]